MRLRRILVVDDDRPSLDTCARALRTLPDAEVEAEEKSADALGRLGTEPWDLVVTDLRMPGADGMDLLKVAQAQDPDMPVLLLTGFPTVDTAVTALKEGATDYLTKPIDIDELLAVAERALKDRAIRAEYGVLERRLRSDTEATEIVGVSDAVVHVMTLSRQLAESDLDVLIVGETGTGKELFARRIHELTTDRSGHFVTVDCGTTPTTSWRASSSDTRRVPSRAPTEAPWDCSSSPTRGPSSSTRSSPWIERYRPSSSGCCRSGPSDAWDRPASRRWTCGSSLPCGSRPRSSSPTESSGRISCTGSEGPLRRSDRRSVGMAGGTKRHGKPKTFRERGFTLVELVVVAIIGILASLVVPRVNTAVNKANATSLANDMRTVRRAIFEYFADHNDWPPAVQPGQVPHGLDRYLPDGFAFGTPDVRFAYVNLADGGWGRWGEQIGLGVSIEDNRTLQEALERMLDDDEQPNRGEGGGGLAIFAPDQEPSEEAEEVETVGGGRFTHTGRAGGSAGRGGSAGNGGQSGSMISITSLMEKAGPSC